MNLYLKLSKLRVWVSDIVMADKQLSLESPCLTSQALRKVKDD